eukprot:gene1623-992_t
MHTEKRVAFDDAVLPFFSPFSVPEDYKVRSAAATRLCEKKPWWWVTRVGGESCENAINLLFLLVAHSA